MLELKVTVNAEPQLLGAIDRIAAALTGAKLDFAPIQTGAEIIPPPPAYPNPVPSAPVTAAPAPAIQPPATTAANPTPVAPVAPTAPPPAPAVPTTAAPAFTVDQIMTAGAALIDAGRMNDLMGLLNAFGVQAVTHLKPEQLGAFATELRKLGAQI